MLDAIDSRVIALIVGVLVYWVADLGYRAARRLPEGEVNEKSFDLVQAATFTMVGLLLAFSFSLALNRYDSRRTAILNEANSIGTTILRSELLDQRTAGLIRATLRDYLETRIAFVAEETSNQNRDLDAIRSATLQRQMWDLAIKSSADSHSTRVPFFLTSLNATIDAAGNEAAVHAAHIPDAIIYILIVIVLISVGLLGVRAGLAGRPASVPTALLAIVFALVVSMIVDLDRPQGGLIIVSLTPLENVRQMFSTP